MDLLDFRAHDGSRKFAALPESVSWRRLCEHLRKRPDLELGDFLTDRVTEGWVDFTYGGHRFTVNNQFGEYWFFVDDPRAPDDVLREIADYCAQLLASGRSNEGL